MQLLNTLIAAFFHQMQAILATYCQLVAVYLLLHFSMGERWSIVSLINNIAHLVILPCLPALLLLRHPHYGRWWRLCALPGILALVIWYGPQFLPRFTQPSSDRTFAVATFNLRSPIYAESKIEIIKALHADLVGVQEMGGHAEWRDRATTGLLQLYPHHALSEHLGVFSRYPVLSDETQIIYRDNTATTPTAVRTLIQFEDRTIAVYVAHFIRPTLTLRPLAYERAPRHADITATLEMIAQETVPVILLCDCNFSPQTQDYSWLTLHLTDVWRQAGWGMGWTAPENPDDLPFPIVRSDYIWADSNLRAISIHVGPESGLSDHRPVLAHLQLP